MEIAKERRIAQLELKTQEYSVFITDEKRTSSGSGVLFYPEMEGIFISLPVRMY